LSQVGHDVLTGLLKRMGLDTTKTFTCEGMAVLIKDKVSNTPFTSVTETETSITRCWMDKRSHWMDKRSQSRREVT